MAKIINKKSELKRQAIVNKTFTNICEIFVKRLSEQSFNFNSVEVVKSLEELDKRWRCFARSVIDKNKHIYSNKDKRTRFTSAFINFTDKLTKNNKQIKDIDVVEPILVEPTNNIESKQKLTQEDLSLPNLTIEDLGFYDINDIIQCLKYVGVNTRSKTLKGLIKVVLKLNTEQLKSFSERLNTKC